MKMEITDIKENEDGDIECSCGNLPSGQGFNPCDEEGNIIDAHIGNGWKGLYLCDGCNKIYRIID